MDNGYYRPLRPGAQIAVSAFLNFGTAYGTIGCFVQPLLNWGNNSEHVKVLTPHPCILTSYHVLKTDKIKLIDDYVHQPVPIGFDRVVASYYVGEWDIALCVLDDRAYAQQGPSNNILGDIGYITGIADLSEGIPGQTPLRKYGRSTGFTKGHYESDLECLGQTMKTTCFRVVTDGGENFCEEGDSGAALVNAKNQLVGILQGEMREPNQPFLIGIGIRADYVFARLTALVIAKEDPNYPIESYPNKKYSVRLL